MPYDGYNWSNASNIGRAVIDAPNHSTGDWFWTAMLYLVWVIVLGVLSVMSFEIGLLVSSFGALIVGIFLVYLGAVAWQWVAVFAGIILFEIIYIVWMKN